MILENPEESSKNRGMGSGTEPDQNRRVSPEEMTVFS